MHIPKYLKAYCWRLEPCTNSPEANTCNAPNSRYFPFLLFAYIPKFFKEGSIPTKERSVTDSFIQSIPEYILWMRKELFEKVLRMYELVLYL